MNNDLHLPFTIHHSPLSLTFAHYDTRKITGSAVPPGRDKEVSLTSKTDDIKLKKTSSFR